MVKVSTNILGTKEKGEKKMDQQEKVWSRRK